MDDSSAIKPRDQKFGSHYFALRAGAKLFEFEIISVLGYGGFGITYLAMDTLLEERVALKEFFPNDLAVRITDASVRAKSDGEQPDFEAGLKAFLEETRLIARFRHSNIVHVRRFFRLHGTGYIVQDYVQGRTLSERLDEGEIKEAELRGILSGVLDGLEVVHNRAVLHRDLKPDNIILRDDGTPVLIDFGAARDFAGRLSRSVTAIAAGSYTPPEQWGAGGQQGPWSDLYALGAIAYRCVTGTAPPMSLQRLRTDALIPAVVAAEGRFDPVLLRTIDWMLTIDETERPPSVAAVRDSMMASETAAAVPIKDLASPRLMPGADKSSDAGPSRSFGLKGLLLACALAGLGIALATYGWRLVRQTDRQAEAQERVLNQSLQDAGFNEQRIEQIVALCGSSCPKDINELAQKRLRQIVVEQQEYRAARNDADRLHDYLNSCVACSFKSEANLELQKLDERRRESDERARIAKDEENSYKAARGDMQKLQAYVSSCAICLFKDDANKGIAALQQLHARQQDAGLDAQKYQQARGNLDLLRNYIQTCITCTYKSAALQEAASLSDDLQMSMIKVCNKSDRRASVAAMGRTSPASDEWHVQGWWSVPVSQCVNLRKFVKGTVYLFAQEDGNPSFAWKGSAKRICVAFPGPFDRINHDGDDCRSSEKPVSFSSFTTSDDTFTWDLNP